MKNIKRLMAWVALGLVAFTAAETAEAHGCYHGCYAREWASAFCSVQHGYGLQCTVVQHDHGCGYGWHPVRVFSDGYWTYDACMY